MEKWPFTNKFKLFSKGVRSIGDVDKPVETGSRPPLPWLYVVDYSVNARKSMTPTCPVFQGKEMLSGQVLVRSSRLPSWAQSPLGSLHGWLSPFSLLSWMRNYRLGQISLLTVRSTWCGLPRDDLAVLSSLWGPGGFSMCSLIHKHFGCLPKWNTGHGMCTIFLGVLTEQWWPGPSHTTHDECVCHSPFWSDACHPPMSGTIRGFPFNPVNACCLNFGRSALLVLEELRGASALCNWGIFYPASR